MRLELLRQLSKEERKKVHAQSVKEIQESYEEMCKTGKWYPPKTKDLEHKNNGIEYTLWEAHQ